MMFQDYAPFPHITVGQHIANGLRAKGIYSRTHKRALLKCRRLSGSRTTRPASASAFRRVRLCAKRRYCCWMNPYLGRTPNCANTCRLNSSACMKRRVSGRSVPPIDFIQTLKGADIQTSVSATGESLHRYLKFCNTSRRHSSLDGQTPDLPYFSPSRPILVATYLTGNPPTKRLDDVQKYQTTHVRACLSAVSASEKPSVTLACLGYQT